MTEKMTKRKQQALNTKNKIYETAVQLLKEGRFEQLKVEDICREANVSIGSFYNSFNSKNDIFIEIYQVADEYFMSYVRNSLKSGDVFERIMKFFNLYAEYNIKQGVEFMRHLYHVDNHLFISKGRPMQMVLSGIIEEGQKSGELKCDYSPEETVTFLFTCARGIVYDWCLHHGCYNLSDRINSYMKLLLVSLDNR